jgi:urease accessory protein
VIEVTVGNRLLLYDPVALRQEGGGVAARMGRFDVLAVAVIAGPALGVESERLLESCRGRPVVRHADQLVTAAPLGRDGCLLRIAGTSVEHVGHTLRELLPFIRTRLGDDPWRRKW